LEDKKKKRATVLGDAYDGNGGAVIAEGNLDPGGSRCGLGNRGSGGYLRERERVKCGSRFGGGGLGC